MLDPVLFLKICMCFIFITTPTHYTLHLSTTTLPQVGEKQRALEALQAETADNTKLIDELHTSLESAIHERYRVVYACWSWCAECLPVFYDIVDYEFRVSNLGRT